MSPSESCVAKLTPAPGPRCEACEGNLVGREAGKSLPKHVEVSYICVNERCAFAQVCMTCHKNLMWMAGVDAELGADLG